MRSSSDTYARKMYLSVVVSRFAAALAVLSGTTAAIGLNMLRQDFTLAGELGIEPGELLSKQGSVHQIAMHRVSQNISTQYATVSPLCRLLSF